MTGVCYTHTHTHTHIYIYIYMHPNRQILVKYIQLNIFAKWRPLCSCPDVGVWWQGKCKKNLSGFRDHYSEELSAVMHMVTPVNLEYIPKKTNTVCRIVFLSLIASQLVDSCIMFSRIYQSSFTDIGQWRDCPRTKVVTLDAWNWHHNKAHIYIHTVKFLIINSPNFKT